MGIGCLANHSPLIKPAVWSTLGYIFFSVIPYATFPRYAFEVLMLITLFFNIFNGEIRKPSADSVTLSLFMLSAVATLSAFLGPFVADSLTVVRKETLPILLAFLLITCQKFSYLDRVKVVRYVYAALIGGFAVRLCLAIWAGINNDWIFSVYEKSTNWPRYLDFFAADIIYYLPFMLSPLLFWKVNHFIRFVLAAITLTTLLFVLVAGVRTTFIFVCATLLFFCFYRFWLRKWLLLAIVFVCIAIAGLARDNVTNPSIQRYYSLFSAKTYQFGNDVSLSERKAVAKAVWEISENRLWLGYGPGWKKLATIAVEGGYVDRWKASTEEWQKVAASYFMLGVGRVNPHNFYLSVLFEVGVLGLAAYLALLVLIGAQSFLKCFWTRTAAKDELCISITSLVYVAICLGSGFAGGSWLPITLLVVSVSSVLSRHKENRNFYGKN